MHTQPQTVLRASLHVRLRESVSLETGNVTRSPTARTAQMKWTVLVSQCVTVYSTDCAWLLSDILTGKDPLIVWPGVHELHVLPNCVIMLMIKLIPSIENSYTNNYIFCTWCTQHCMLLLIFAAISFPCGFGFFNCTTIGCININLLCDNSVDCPADSSDEDDCRKWRGGLDRIAGNFRMVEIFEFFIS